MGRVSLTVTLGEQRPGQRPGETGEGEGEGEGGAEFVIMNIRTLFNNKPSQSAAILTSTVSVNVSLLTLSLDWDWRH